MIKVEVIGCSRSLLPDPVETLKASEQLLEEGFIVLPYTSDDVVLARKLEELGVHAIMPGASPIGSGQGILNPLNLSFIIEQAKVPVIVDAGIGSPKDAAYAMELGADGVLLNTAVSGANDPVKMARAMKLAVEAGRLSYEAGRIRLSNTERQAVREKVFLYDGQVLAGAVCSDRPIRPEKIEGSARRDYRRRRTRTASAEMLVRAGVGSVKIADRDYVEWSNLQRQQLYTEDDVKKKCRKQPRRSIVSVRLTAMSM